MSTDRSVSRGREAPIVVSLDPPYDVGCRTPVSLPPKTYGRGGAGNKVRSPSRDDTNREVAGPDDYSNTRGRELPPSATGERIVTYGRGGAANHRSLSRDAVVESRNALKEEAKYVREHQNTDVAVSHGRGGAGNISNSRSRSRSRDPAATTAGNPAAIVGVLHGRGGLGNVRNSEDTGSTLERLAEEDDAKRVGAEKRDREEKEGQVYVVLFTLLLLVYLTDIYYR
ncbi:hypothetical protein FRC16_004391 [Serendipita sp. 398]|nr:hypothetical protein FRC16_004391 [Serendipita sp. 398]